MQFQKSAASGKRAARLIKEKKLMNVEHRTSNIEHRIMYSIYFKRTERSDSIIRRSTFAVRHSIQPNRQQMQRRIDK
ncbi:hypothetical protein D1AOALGA4SA_12689 [Olavius algarvensis Delta 1 endosymbiont]|nr:hypothetical protein D1AOALGA4SA_12689 [Olavius algarvensis Delta 1 endosymbiont]